MTDFEEDFPSLDKKEKKGMLEGVGYHNRWFTSADIIAGCLDKQKVREVIDKLKENSKGTHTEEGATLLVNHLKKELNL